MEILQDQCAKDFLILFSLNAPVLRVRLMASHSQRWCAVTGKPSSAKNCNINENRVFTCKSESGEQDLQLGTKLFSATWMKVDQKRRQNFHMPCGAEETSVQKQGGGITAGHFGRTGNGPLQLKYTLPCVGLECGWRKA